MSFLDQLLQRATGNSSLSAADFVAHRDASAPLLDVRTPGEFAEGRLAGAVNIDLMSPTFADELFALRLSADAPVYLYCRSGNRSGQAAHMLRQMGHEGAVNIGGIDALARAGAEVG